MSNIDLGDNVIVLAGKDMIPALKTLDEKLNDLIPDTTDYDLMYSGYSKTVCVYLNSPQTTPDLVDRVYDILSNWKPDKISRVNVKYDVKTQCLVAELKYL